MWVERNYCDQGAVKNIHVYTNCICGCKRKGSFPATTSFSFSLLVDIYKCIYWCSSENDEVWSPL